LGRGVRLGTRDQHDRSSKGAGSQGRANCEFARAGYKFANSILETNNKTASGVHADSRSMTKARIRPTTELGIGRRKQLYGIVRQFVAIL
jgi:hypothetical protein